MYKIIKKIALGAVLGVSLLVGNKVEAQVNIFATNLFTPLAGTNSWTNQLLTGQFYISQITVSAGTIANPQIVNFYDGAGTNQNTYYISNAWFYRTTITTNITSVLTNALGTVYTNIYPGQYTVISSNAAGVYASPPLTVFAINSGGTQSQTANSFQGGRFITVNGLVCTTSGNQASNLTVLVYYTTNQP